MDAIRYFEAAYVYKKVLLTDYQQVALLQPTNEETKREITHRANPRTRPHPADG